MVTKRFETRQLSDIHPYENNPRRNDDAVADVMESIKQCDNLDPIEVDKDGIILSGHTRLKALKKLGYTDTEVVVYEGLTDEQKRKCRLLANKTGEKALWDLDLLATELEGLDFGDFDFGFENGLGVTEIDEIEPPEPPDVPVAKVGDIWLLGRHRLMCGDSTDAACVEQLMDGALADMLLTDPPYGVDYTGKTKEQLKIENDRREEEDFITFLTDAFTAADSVMKPGAVFYIWHADSKAYVFRAACHATGLEVRQVLIWVKNSMVMGRQDYQWKHEPCLYGWKGGAGHLWASDRKQTTIMEFDRPTKSVEHPTMKPVALFDYQMQNNTKGGDIVLDLFSGSGTTIIAAEQNGRTAYAMELDPRFVDVAVQRWETLTGEKAVRVDG